MNEIKSIWDGWEKQCFNACHDDNGGSCAMAYASNRDFSSYYESGLRKRVAEYIRFHYSLPLGWTDDGTQPLDMRRDGEVIIYANNVLKLTPEDFRRIDRETQIEAAVKPLVDSILPVSEVVEVMA